MSELSQPTSVPAVAASRKAKSWQRLLPLLIAAACFTYLYNSLNHAATAEGTSLLSYLAKSFERVNWYLWLALMVPYCFFYLIFDSLMIWCVINWFNAKVSYADILPIRASAYILSMVNEQVSKGAIALYLNRRDGVPGWEVGSSMIFITFCEFYSLILWATFGVLLALGPFPASLPRHSVDRPGRHRVFRASPLIFQRKNSCRFRSARPSDLSSAPPRQVVALPGRSAIRAPLVIAACARLYRGFEAFWRHNKLW